MIVRLSIYQLTHVHYFPNDEIARRDGKGNACLREDAVALEDLDEPGAELAEEDVVEEAGEEAAVVLERLERYPLRDGDDLKCNTLQEKLDGDDAHD